MTTGPARPPAETGSPPDWWAAAALVGGRTGAAACATALLAAAVWWQAEPLARLVASLPLVRGTEPLDHYIGMLRSTALAWTGLGPALVVAAAVALRLLRAGHRPPSFLLARRVAVAIAAAVLTTAALVPRQATGDEPAYLIMASSLVRDGDVQAPEAGPEFHPSPCARPGVVVSKHPPGVGALVALPWLMGGERGARLAMAGLGMLLCWVLIGFLRPIASDPQQAIGAALLISVSFPLAPFSTLIFPDLPAALCLLVTTVALTGRTVRPSAAGVAMAVLPWLNPRMLPPAALLLAWGWLDRRVSRSTRVALSLSFLASLSWMAWLHLRWFGSASPFAARWCSKHLFRFTELISGTLGILVDQQYGLLVWAPLFLLLPVGMVLLWHRSKASAAGLAVLAAATTGPGILHNWTAGWSPAARYVVPVIPLLAVPLVLAIGDGLHRGGWRERAVRWLIRLQLAAGAVALLLPGKLFGTMEAVPHNFYLHLLERATGIDSRWFLPSLRSGPHPWAELHAGLLVAVWLALSALWCGLARVSGGRGEATPGPASSSGRGAADGRSWS